MRAYINILSLFIILFPSPGLGQNYQCVQDSSINYFTNKDHYLRAIRIDSTRTINGNTVLYPYKTARGDYNGNKFTLRKKGSWLGETISILPDGTHYFSNYADDTVVIKTSAALNDSWVFYDDTSLFHYEATVTGEDTMTVLGTLDSVKTIIITAKDTAGIVVPNIYTGKVIVFSKNHGFVRCFDLYNFPSQLPHGFDYYSYKAQSMDFSLVSFHNPTTVELHDYKIGDRFQRMDYSYMYVNVAYTSLLILHKQVSGSQVTYNVLETVEKVKAVPPLGNETVMSVINIVADNRTFLDLQKLPEEWGGRVILFYNPLDAQFCYIGKYYASMPNFAYYLGDSAMINTFEPCGTSISYKLGAGIIVYAECNDPTGFNPYWYLKYVNKNNNPCGSYFTLSVDKTSAENDGIKVYPNPANNYLSIEANEIALAVDFIDVTGRVVKKVQLSNLNERVDITDISSGMFLLRFRDGMGNQTYQKLLIQH